MRNGGKGRERRGREKGVRTRGRRTPTRREEKNKNEGIHEFSWEGRGGRQKPTGEETDKIPLI